MLIVMWQYENRQMSNASAVIGRKRTVNPSVMAYPLPNLQFYVIAKKILIILYQSVRH